MSGGRRSLREVVTHNFGLKLTSLFVAIALFSMVRGAEDAQRSVFVDVAVALPGETDAKILVSDVPERVRLTLRGSRSQVNAIRPEELTVTMDLTDTSLQYYYFAEDDFDVPASVQLSQIAPASVPLRWAERIERVLPIEPELTGELPAGLVLVEPPRVQPLSMNIAGPRSSLRDLDRLLTAPIDLSTLDVGDRALRVPLAPAPERSRFASEDPITVTVRVAVERRERRLEAVTVVPRRPEGESGRRSELRIQPSRVVLRIAGPVALVEAVDAEAVEVEADLTSAEAGSKVPLRVLGLPEGVDVAAIDPPAVTVE